MALGASREGGFWTLGVGWIGGGAGKPCLWTPGLPELLGKGYCGPSLSGVGLGQAEGSWSQTSELPGEGRGRKGGRRWGEEESKKEKKVSNQF